MKKRYKKKEYEKIEKEVVKYFFSNTNNDYKTLRKKFGISTIALYRMITDEFRRRYNKRNKNE
jgi:hypothetical protein